MHIEYSASAPVLCGEPEDEGDCNHTQTGLCYTSQLDSET